MSLGDLGFAMHATDELGKLHRLAIAAALDSGRGYGSRGIGSDSLVEPVCAQPTFEKRCQPLLAVREKWSGSRRPNWGDGREN